MGARSFPFAPDWFVVEQVTDVVWSIREPHHEQDVLAYLLTAGREPLLIDSGMGFADIGAVVPEVPARVLLTHSHWDHMGGAAGFAKVSVADDEWEKARLARGWPRGEVRGFGPGAFPDTHYLEPDADTIAGFSIAPVPRFETFRDGDRIDLGDDRLVVMQTPGHTPGSTSFFLERRGYLFTGDTLYPGPEYIHLPESDYRAYLTSLQRLVEDVGRHVHTIFPGHNANRASPELLERHAQAARGELPPDNVLDWSAAPGRPHHEFVWRRTETCPRFSFRLPLSFSGFA